MNTNTSNFSPGDLVWARNREWVLLEEAEGCLKLRPFSGSESDVETIVPELEIEEVRPAQFDPPEPDHTGNQIAAVLLRDALKLSLRRGAGPFRSTGWINFEPRAYQIAPLMMALRQETIRLLNADDVGIGKTIETGLILRELIDRGEINRFVVLCPPHLVDQWTGELESKFMIPITAVTASVAARLERDLPTNESVFEAYPYTVVSMDFIKSQRRVADFQRACPDMVVVDEAHTVVGSGQGVHRRYDLVKKLSEKKDRHLILLTATPHSGNDISFQNLIGLLNPEFEKLMHFTGHERRNLREKLASHFIQRRRPDIDAWREPNLFPQHETAELSYKLAGNYKELYKNVLEYCAEAVESSQQQSKQRFNFWGTLALMRCVGSSPAAALRALKNRTQIENESFIAQILDDDEYSENDLETGVTIEDPRLLEMIEQATRLANSIESDPKFLKLVQIVTELVDEKFKPVVFCRFVATAESIAKALKDKFSNYQIEAVTGSLPSEERERRVEKLGEEEKRLLVATDCLSEGVNLQEYFDAVIHYDLSWNPTRHQQRGGRVDRFGQKSPIVKSVLLFGEDNPVDGTVLKVILKKAESIERQTGVRVPIPDNDGSLMKALLSAVLLKSRGQGRQASLFDVDTVEEERQIEIAWTNASENEKKARTIFAQNTLTLKVGDVMPEWEHSQKILGGYPETRRFVSNMMMRLCAPLKQTTNGYSAPIHLTPENIRERITSECSIPANFDQAWKIAFKAKSPPGFQSVHRTHPLTGVLAGLCLEQVLNRHVEKEDVFRLPRTGAWETDSVEEVFWLIILRIRHRIHSQGRLGPQLSMVEEASGIAVSSTNFARTRVGEEALQLLDTDGSDLSESIKKSNIEEALQNLDILEKTIYNFAQERAETLADDHMRVRQVLRSKARVAVSPILPTDVIGMYVLMPKL